jgi:hypothetical protein
MYYAREDSRGISEPRESAKSRIASFFCSRYQRSIPGRLSLAGKGLSNPLSMGLTPANAAEARSPVRAYRGSLSLV